MSTKLVEEENTIYEVDEDCMREQGKLPDIEEMVASQEACACRGEQRNDRRNRSCNGCGCGGCQSNSSWCFLLLCICLLCRC